MCVGAHNSTMEIRYKRRTSRNTMPYDYLYYDVNTHDGKQNTEAHRRPTLIGCACVCLYAYVLTNTRIGNALGENWARMRSWDSNIDN